MINILKKNWNNIKNRWKGITSLIFLKTVASSVPTVLSLDNGYIVTNSYDTANIFNNYFASLAKTTRKSIRHSHKNFSSYLSNEDGSAIFLQFTDNKEIANTISSLNSNKASDPKSVPYRILFFLKK